METGISKLKVEPDGSITAKYRMKMPEGYIEPENFPFCMKSYSTTFEWVKGHLIPDGKGNFADLDIDRQKISFVNYEQAKPEIEYIAYVISRRIDETEYIINQSINGHEWYKKISDFIEALAFSAVLILK